MRDYGKVLPAFWTRGSGKALRGDAAAQVVALYLFTCPSATMTGLFYLPLPTLAHETGIPLEGVREALGRVSEAGIACYDEAEELVWVPEMARIQIGEALVAKDNRIKAVERELATYAKHAFYNSFLARYSDAYRLSSKSNENPLPTPFRPPSDPLGSQEQDQEQDQKQEQESFGDGASPGVSKVFADEPPLLTIVEPAKPRKRKAKQEPKPKPPKTRARILEEAFALGCEDYTHVARPIPWHKQDGVALESVADARCKGLDAEAEAAWIRAAAWRWTRARDVDEHKGQYFPGGVKVDGFAQWIGTETVTAESEAERVRRSIKASVEPTPLPLAPKQEPPREPRVVLPPGYRPTLVIPTSVTPVIDTTRFWHRKPIRQEQDQEAVNE